MYLTSTKLITQRVCHSLSHILFMRQSGSKILLLRFPRNSIRIVNLR